MNDISAEIVQQYLKEKRSERRWRNIRFVCWFALIAVIVWNMMSGPHTKSIVPIEGKYVSLVRLQGMIAPDRDFSAETVVPILEDAFSDKQAQGVIIDINS